MSTKPLKSNDPLYRGDSKDGITLPDPRATRSVVAHILYLDGYGRATPFLSTSEDKNSARHFAKDKHGHLYTTSPERAADHGVFHLSLQRLVQDLRGMGRGECSWHDAREVAQACANAKRWREHLLDWRVVKPEAVPQVAKTVFMR